LVEEQLSLRERRKEQSLAEETAEETSWQEQSWQEQSLQEAAKEPVKSGDVAAERTAAKTAVNCGLAKKTKQPVSCSLGTSLALARLAGIHALLVDLAGLRARVG
jgi:hypothetical protein